MSITHRDRIALTYGALAATAILAALLAVACRSALEDYRAHAAAAQLEASRRIHAMVESSAIPVAAPEGPPLALSEADVAAVRAALANIRALALDVAERAALEWRDHARVDAEPPKVDLRSPADDSAHTAYAGRVAHAEAGRRMWRDMPKKIGTAVGQAAGAAFRETVVEIVPRWFLLSVAGVVLAFVALSAWALLGWVRARLDLKEEQIALKKTIVLAQGLKVGAIKPDDSATMGALIKGTVADPLFHEMKANGELPNGR